MQCILPYTDAKILGRSNCT